MVTPSLPFPGFVSDVIYATRSVRAVSAIGHSRVAAADKPPSLLICLWPFRVSKTN